MDVVDLVVAWSVEVAFVFLSVIAVGLDALNSRKPKPGVIRGQESWQNFALAYVLLFGTVWAVVGSSELSRPLVHVVNSVLAFYLCFLSPWFRNKVVGYANRLKRE